MTDKKQELVFLPLGGAGEIGMNLNLYGCGPEDDREWIMVDLGITFASEEGYPGVDLVFPDISFIEEERDNLKAIILTHGHEDHIGAVIDLWPRLKAPVYATPFVVNLMKAKMAENYVETKIPFHAVKPGDTIDLGAFSVEFVPVAHSIPEPVSLVIRAGGQTLVHSGDWKIDPDPRVGPHADLERLKEIGDAGVDVLICDSTNAIKAGFSPSEGQVAEVLKDVISQATGRVAVTLFASNVARMQSIMEAAEASNRKVILAGRAINRMVQVARDTGYLGHLPEIVPDTAFSKLPRDQVLMITSGSQGEPRAATSRLARDDHPVLRLSAGDTVIFSSRTIPGNEKAVGAVQNALLLQGIEVITDADGLIHVSGHPRQGELKQVYELLRPKSLIPVHGEALHLIGHDKFARACGIRDVMIALNGDMIALKPSGLEMIDQARHGRFLKDGKEIIEVDAPAIRQRRALAFGGMVFIALAVDDRGRMADDPFVDAVGIPEMLGGAETEELIYDEIENIFNGLSPKKRMDSEAVRDAIRKGVRNTLSNRWGKKPLCQVAVLEV